MQRVLYLCEPSASWCATVSRGDKDTCSALATPFSWLAAVEPLPAQPMRLAKAP